MKRFMLVIAAITFFSTVFICDAFAESWTLYSKNGSTSYFYAEEMGYLHDAIGPTPYTLVAIKGERSGKVFIKKIFVVDAEVTMMRPYKQSTTLIAAAFDDWVTFESSDFRLVKAIKLWKRTHKQ